MNPSVLLPLLAAACMAAPGGILRSGLVHNGGFIQNGAFIQNAGLVHTGLPVGGAITYSAPAIQQVQVQVPVTKTVHYETKPVVTGYSTSIIKPAIATGFAAAPLPQVQQVLVQGIEFPPLPSFPAFPPSNGTADAPSFPNFPSFPTFPQPNATAPGADAPQLPTLPPIGSLPIPTLPPISTPPGGGDNTNETGSFYQDIQYPQSLPVQQSFDFTPHVFNPINLVSIGQQTVVQAQPAQIAVEAPSQDAVVVEARAAVPVQAPVQFAQAPIAVAQPVVAFRAAQAGDFEPLVTKEKVLAPVRAHTEITPQVTQIQPEVTVRKVIHDVPVAQPIAVQTPVTYAVHNPVVATGHQVIAGPQAVAYSSNVFNGQPIHYGSNVFAGQPFPFNGQQIVV